MKVSINNPCHENWDTMTPNEQGAFCLSCQKTVVDFSQKTTQEIKDFFAFIPQTDKVCGRFKNEQLKELSFDEFFIKFKSWILPKKVAVILFFCFGLTLFSCQTVHEPLMGDVSIETTIVTPPEDLIAGKVEYIRDTNVKVVAPIKTNTVEIQKFKMGEVAIMPPENNLNKEPKCGAKDTLIEENYIKGKVKINE